MKIAFITLGCRTNQAESLQIEQNLLLKGHQIVDFSENPDVCIVNTCAVTSKADSQSRQVINKALKNNVKIIATGCYTELNKEKLKDSNSGMEIVSNIDKLHIINMFNNLPSSKTSSLMKTNRHRPIVKVQDGCNYSCSYCTIPIARGKSKSIQPDAVIKSAMEFEAMGYKEIVLTGIHLGTYGLDLDNKMNLAALLERILMNTNIPRIRLSSLEIKEIDDKLLELFSDRRICDHLHIPLQSGDDNILKLMNRNYSVAEYLKGIEMIKKKHQDMSLGTDVIAGFPGEGENEYKNTRNILNYLPFSYMHVFPYSKRRGTRALKLHGQVPDPIRKERVSELREIGYSKKKHYILRQIDKTLDIIIENRTSAGFEGTTGNYIKVLLRDCQGLEGGMLANISITGYEDGKASGKVVNV